MEEDWETYCLMSAISFIEEMSKPLPGIQIKMYKDKKYRCECFRSIRLKMKEREFIDKLLSITQNWEARKKLRFLGKSFGKPKIEAWSGQHIILFTPLWINYILSECGGLPNKYADASARYRIDRFVQYEKIPIKNIDKFSLLFKNKFLAAGAFIISMDLECRGIQSGRPTLCMSERYKDFLEFMLGVAKTWGWTTNDKLSSVSVDYSRNLGINASPQFEFRISTKGLQEIYSLAGPLTIKNKENCIAFHVNRSKNYKNEGGRMRQNNTKEKIFQSLKRGNNTTTLLQFDAGVGIDVILDHLHKFEKEGKVIKRRTGKRYVWSIK